MAALATVVVLSRDNGSYFATSWGWEAMIFLGLAATGFIFMVSIRMSRLHLAFIGGLSAFVAWSGLSALWSESVPSSIREVERDVVYLGLALSLAVFARYLAPAGLVLGLLSGITAVSAYALSSRLFPTHFAAPDPTFGYRLSAPLGYWNALGLLAAMGLILAFGAAALSGSRVIRMAAAASTCVITPAMLFTFSRGAWIAASVGVMAMFVLDSRRIRLASVGLVLAGPIACVVWIGATSDALAKADASRDLGDAGRRYALAVIVAAAAAALLAEAAHRLVSRIDPGKTAERRFSLVVMVVALGCVAGGVIVAGGPVSAAQEGWTRFRADIDTSSGNPSSRLRSISNNSRVEHWRVAWDNFREHPVAGSGAGTYEQVWYRERRVDVTIRDAHSLYLEVLAEVGAVGALLLITAIAAALVGFVRARKVPYAPAAAGAFAAYVAHAGIDWDWEVVDVTAAALVAGCVGFVALWPGERPLTLRWPVRLGVFALVSVAAVFAFVSFVGNRELASGRRALADGQLRAAAERAERASRALRWSIEPLFVLADARGASGDIAGARATLERATARDPESWQAWLALSEVTSGAQQQQARAEAHRLNPIGVPE